jgi:hypothetical protein
MLKRTNEGVDIAILTADYTQQGGSLLPSVPTPQKSTVETKAITRFDYLVIERYRDISTATTLLLPQTSKA